MSILIFWIESNFKEKRIAVPSRDGDPFFVVIFRKTEEYTIEYLEKGIKEKVVDQGHAKYHKRNQHEYQLVRRGTLEADLSNGEEMYKGGGYTDNAH